MNFIDILFSLGYDVRFEKEKMKLKRMVNKIDSKRVPAPPLAEVKKAKSSTFGKHSSKNMVKGNQKLLFKFL